WALVKMVGGKSVELEVAFGHFHLRASDRSVILLASGTGFAPIKSMIETAIHADNRRPMHLYWGARKRADIYLADLPALWARRLQWFSFTPVLSDPDASWRGRTGLVHNAVREDHASLANADVYACGNPLMVSAAQQTFVKHHGLADAHYFADAFVASGPSTSDELQPLPARS